MSTDFSFLVEPQLLFEQVFEGTVLGSCEISFRYSKRFLHTADQADSQGIPVVTFDMGSYSVGFSSGFDVTFSPDNPMISDVCPSKPMNFVGVPGNSD